MIFKHLLRRSGTLRRIIKILNRLIRDRALTRQRRRIHPVPRSRAVTTILVRRVHNRRAVTGFQPHLASDIPVQIRQHIRITARTLFILHSLRHQRRIRTNHPISRALLHHHARKRLRHIYIRPRTVVLVRGRANKRTRSHAIDLAERLHQLAALIDIRIHPQPVLLANSRVETVHITVRIRPLHTAPALHTRDRPLHIRRLSIRVRRLLRSLHLLLVEFRVSLRVSSNLRNLNLGHLNLRQTERKRTRTTIKPGHRVKRVHLGTINRRHRPIRITELRIHIRPIRRVNTTRTTSGVRVRGSRSVRRRLNHVTGQKTITLPRDISQMRTTCDTP